MTTPPDQDKRQELREAVAKAICIANPNPLGVCIASSCANCEREADAAIAAYEEFM